LRGTIRPSTQTSKGRLYQRKDFNAASVVQLYHNFETGMIPEYLADQERRDSVIDLVSLGDAP